MFGLPQDRNTLEHFVMVDFIARPQSLAESSINDFEPLKPIGPCYTSYNRHFAFLLDALRQFHCNHVGTLVPARNDP